MAMKHAEPKARLLMGHPRHFAVSYRINPWMDPQGWVREERALATASADEWAALHDRLQQLGARIEEVPGVPGLPDLVFTANAAVVLDRTALLARFRHPERQAEEPHFAAAFRRLQARGLIDAVRSLPKGVVLEGAGDCLWDSARRLFWMGYGQRSDASARHAVEDTFGFDVIALELADPRFYHLDTAFCPLPGGDVIYLPEAFTAADREVIRDRVSADCRIEITLAEASRLAANAVAIDDAVVLVDDCSDALRMRLQKRGYRVIGTPLASFRRSGGAAFCLTLRLDRRSGVAGAEARAVATGRSRG